MFTAHQAVASSINEYPRLYSSYSYEDSKFMVLDQIFNVLGSGINNLDHLKNHYPGIDGPSMPEEKYINGTPTFTGYTNTEKFDMGDADALIMPDLESQTASGVLLEDQHNHPHAVYWLAEGPNDRSPPYPNFAPKYSWAHTVTKEDWASLDPSWLEEAIWFYQECRNYFSDPLKSASYDKAYPHADDFEHEDKLLSATEQVMELKKGRTKDQWLQAVSQQYGFPFTGDINKLLSDKWNAEKIRIVSFIDATLENLHNARPSVKHTI